MLRVNLYTVKPFKCNMQFKKKRKMRTYSLTMVLNSEKVLIKLRHFSAKHTTFLCELGLL